MALMLWLDGMMMMMMMMHSTAQHDKSSAPQLHLHCLLSRAMQCI
jgi:hypothetical protein